jgi:cytochrome d ubiquinol oxidase subunit I
LKDHRDLLAADLRELCRGHVKQILPAIEGPAAGAWVAWRRRDIGADRRLLVALALAAPMGFIAIEAGWTVTEVGRQPWIIYGVMRTADAVTPMPGLIYPFTVFTLLYCFLGVIVAWLLYRQIIRSPRGSEWTRIYAPARRGDA